MTTILSSFFREHFLCTRLPKTTLFPRRDGFCLKCLLFAWLCVRTHSQAINWSVLKYPSSLPVYQLLSNLNVFVAERSKKIMHNKTGTNNTQYFLPSREKKQNCLLPNIDSFQFCDSFQIIPYLIKQWE